MSTPTPTLTEAQEREQGQATIEQVARIIFHALGDDPGSGTNLRNAAGMVLVWAAAADRETLRRAAQMAQREAER